MTEEKAVEETSNAQKLEELVRISKELARESERQHTLEERLNTKYDEFQKRLKKLKKENQRMQTTLSNL